MSTLLNPIRVKNITLRNKVVMSPMCQYSAEDGFANDWHFVHYGSRAVGGCAAIVLEATAVSPEGRISYADLGIWKDEHIDNLFKITSFIEENGAVPTIQLAHAGRKASCEITWKGGAQLQQGGNSWQTVSASAIPFDEDDIVPIELSKEMIRGVISDFKEAAKRAIKAGFKILEIHAAHGYLIHQFLSPLTNKRTDEYGGSFENRTRFLLEIIDEMNKVIGEEHSLWVRISATDWADGGWNEVESVRLAKVLKDKGIDLMDVSSGGLLPHVIIPVKPNYQVPFAEKIKKETGIMVGAVGLITEANQAESLLEENKCDLVLMGRELLRNPYFVLDAAKSLKGSLINPPQYGRV